MCCSSHRAVWCSMQCRQNNTSVCCGTLLSHIAVMIDAVYTLPHVHEKEKNISKTETCFYLRVKKSKNVLFDVDPRRTSSVLSSRHPLCGAAPLFPASSPKVSATPPALAQSFSPFPARAGRGGTGPSPNLPRISEPSESIIITRG